MSLLTKTMAVVKLTSALAMATPAFAQGNKAVAVGLLEKGLVKNDKAFIIQ